MDEWDIFFLFMQASRLASQLVPSRCCPMRAAGYAGRAKAGQQARLVSLHRTFW